jgi:limonene-1,2-epoxide hydrolase
MDPAEYMLGFYERMSADFDGMTNTVAEVVHDDCTIGSTGFPPAVGRDAAIALMGAWNEMMAARGIRKIDIDILNWGSRGDVAFVERIDHFKAADGSIVESSEINTVIEFRDGKIWRLQDYMDPRPWVV